MDPSSNLSDTRLDIPWSREQCTDRAAGGNSEVVWESLNFSIRHKRLHLALFSLADCCMESQASIYVFFPASWKEGVLFFWIWTYLLMIKLCIICVFWNKHWTPLLHKYSWGPLLSMHHKPSFLKSIFYRLWFFLLVSITMAPRKYFIHSAHYSLCLINATLKIRKVQFSISCPSL